VLLTAGGRMLRQYYKLNGLGKPTTTDPFFNDTRTMFNVTSQSWYQTLAPMYTQPTAHLRGVANLTSDVFSLPL